MTDNGVSRSTRTATYALWAMIPIGLALIAIGFIEIRWWRQPSTDRLFHLFDLVKADNGLARPSLLREYGGAWELVGLGVIGLAFAAFAPYIRKGTRAARTSVIVAGILLLLYVVVDIGGDSTFTHTIPDYLFQLRNLKPVPGAAPADFAPLWPAGWYSWFEDVAQGVQAIALLVAVIVSASASINQEQPLVVRLEPTDDFGRALRRAVDNRRAQAE